MNNLLQGLDYGEHSRVVCVIPRGSADKFDNFSKLGSLSRVSEVDLLCAVLSGHLDSSMLISPSGQYSYFPEDNVPCLLIYLSQSAELITYLKAASSGFFPSHSLLPIPSTRTCTIVLVS